MALINYKMRLTFIFFELAEAPPVRVLDLVDHVIRLGEVYLVLVPDNLALRLGFQGHFHNVPRFIIEETVRVSQPRNCSEEHTK